MWYSQKQSIILIFFSKQIFDDISPFCGTNDTLIWTSGDVCPRFQSQVGFPRLRASLHSRKDQMVGSQWAYRTRMKSSKVTYTPE